MNLKILLFGVVTAAVASFSATAAPCVSVSYSDYLGAGFSCTVGDKTFSGFSFGSTAGGSGMALTAGNLMVTPEVTQHGPGLLFSSGAISVTQLTSITTDTFIDVTLGFGVSAAGPIIDDAALTVAGGASGSGSATVDETVTTTPPQPVSPMHVGFGSVPPPQVTAVVNFGPVPAVDVLKDIFVDVPAGMTGSANITAISEEFSQIVIPEPGSLALLGGALAGLGIFLRRRKPLE